jgi:hypothetical protein
LNKFKQVFNYRKHGSSILPTTFHYLILFLFVPIVTIPIASAYEDTEITVSLLGSHIINLDNSNKLLRAYVDVFNFDPSDGYHFMQIVHSSTGSIVSEQEIIIREKGNDKAGTNVAFLIDESELNVNGTSIYGDYEIVISSEFGKSVAKTTFSLIKPSEGYWSLKVEDNSTKSLTEEQNEKSSIPPIQLKEDVTLAPLTEIEKEENVVIQNDSTINEHSQFPEWIKDIFIMYAAGDVSESELLNAIKFLIEQEIIIV